MIRVGTDGMPSEAAQKLATRIVESTLPGTWVIPPLGEGSRDFSLRRPIGHRNPNVATAFDYSYRLRKHRDVEDCEPALVLPNTMPLEIQPRRRLTATSTASDEQLPCTSSRDSAHTLCDVQRAWQLPLPAGAKHKAKAS